MIDDWVETTLGAVADICGGGTPSTSESTYWGGDIVWLTPTEVVKRDGARIGTSERTLTEAGLAHSSAKLLPANAVLLTSRASVGFVALADRPLATNQGFQSLIARDGILPEFLMLWIQGNREEFKNRAGGSTFPEISKSNIAGIPILVPPPHIQRRIVDLMAHLDDHLAHLRNESETLGSVLMTRRNALPSSAEVTIAAITVGVDSGKSLMTAGDQPEPGLPRILKLSAVRPGLYDGTQAKSLPDDVALPDSAIVREGDVLVTRSNTPDRVGYCARARQVEHRTYMPDLVWRVRLDESRCLPDYFEQAMASEEMRRRVTQTASGTSSSMVKINKRGYSTVTIPLPDLNEQIDYVAECMALAEVQVALTREIATLLTIRTQVLNLLLTGDNIIAEVYDSLFEGVA